MLRANWVKGAAKERSFASTCTANAQAAKCSVSDCDAARLTSVNARLGNRLLTLMWPASDHSSGDPTPQAGYCKEHNIFGTPTGRIVRVNRTNYCAGGFTWHLALAAGY